MSEFREAVENMRYWYDKSLPRRINNTFRSFAVRTNELANYVMGSQVPMQVKTGIPTACTDGKTIFLPVTYFIPQFFEQLGVTDPTEISACAIACINGSQIHEAYHIHESDCIINEWLSNYGYDDEWLKKPGFLSCLMLTEDLYIEEWGRQEKPFLSDPFVNSKNDVLFSETKMLEYRALLETAETSDQGTLLQLMIFLKNIRYQDHPVFDNWRTLVDIFEKARNIGLTKRDRIKIAIEAYEQLKQEKAADDQALGEPQPGFGDPTAGEGEGEGGKEISGISNQSIDFNSAEGEAFKNFMESLTTEEKEALINLAKKVSDELEYAGRQAHQEAVSGSKWPEVEAIEINPRFGSHLDPDPNFNKMGDYLRRAREMKHTPGQPRAFGVKLLKNRLAHIVSDGNVLAFPDRDTRQLGKPRVIFLMDFSGSMTGLAYDVARATLGSVISLVQAGIPVAVYAHTTLTKEGNDIPAVYKICASEMPLGGNNLVRNSPELIKAKFGAALDIEKRNNYDGLAIEYVAKQFPRTSDTEVLAVLSDGNPHGGWEYSGTTAINHTIEVIKSIRKEGKIVCSFSLTQEVMEDNDIIYGKDMNFKSWGNELEKSLKQFSIELSKPNRKK